MNKALYFPCVFTSMEHIVSKIAHLFLLSIVCKAHKSYLNGMYNLAISTSLNKIRVTIVCFDNVDSIEIVKLYRSDSYIYFRITTFYSKLHIPVWG